MTQTEDRKDSKDQIKRQMSKEHKKQRSKYNRKKIRDEAGETELRETP